MAKRNYTGKELLAMRNQLTNNRDIFTSLWETCRFFYNPQERSSYTFGNNVGGKQMPQNPIGIQSARDLTAGLFANTLDLTGGFFGFEVSDTELSENEDVKKWLAKATEITVRKLADSNYGLVTLQTIFDYVVVCNGVQYSEMTEDKGLRFQNFMIDHCGIAEDKDGRVDTIFRDFEMTASQAVARWGSKAPEKVIKQYEKITERYVKSRYVHCVFPRLEYKKKDLEAPKEMKFASYYVYENTGKKIEEGGYKTFPYAVARFQKNNDDNPYGRGTSFTTKGIMGALELLSADIIDGVEIKVNPPVWLPVGNSDLSDLQLFPGGLNFYNPINGVPIFYQSDIDLSSASVREIKLEQQVKDNFFVELFLALKEQKNMTAFEVNERIGESALMILPVVARLYDELYVVQLKRVFNLLNDGGFYTPMPEILSKAWNEQTFRVKMNTKLDLKLDQLELGHVMKSIEESALLLSTAANFPEINSILKVPEFNKEIFRLNRVSEDFIKTDKETKDYMEAKEQAEERAAAEAQMAEMLEKVSLQKNNEENSLIAQQQRALGGTTGVGGV